MDFRCIVLLVAVASCIVSEGNCLECYNCNNIKEPKCGKTWELSDEDASKYLVECTGDNVACKKLDTTDSNNGMSLVTRSCWSTNTTVELDDEFYSCTDIANQGTACYCTNGKEDGPCNGKQPLLSSASIFVSLISVFVCLFLRKL